ncbi:MAG: M48 family metallopeptidase [Saprospiraceae bacterium]|nr:M48 family metallopeptidase [Saprospiraceae bacterium]MBK9729462.1 M48 family metallopeptidase [Saprospiraceae bacterium]
MPNLKAFSEFSEIHFRDFSLKMETVYENRRSARISLGKHHAILRLPILLSISQKEKHLDWAKNWVIKKFEQDQNLRSRYVPRNYQSGQCIQLRNQEFVLEILEDIDRKTALGNLKGKTLVIHLPIGINAYQKHKLCSTIISRIMASFFQSEISKRVFEINDQFFKKEIKSVRIKYNVSNWGSCSSNKIINLSSRLLLTPQFITDYIIVHELAHLVHMNHSPRFWALVEKVMPEYQKAEKWLNKNGETCNW